MRNGDLGTGRDISTVAPPGSMGIAVWASLFSSAGQGVAALPQCHGLECDRSSHIS